MTGQFAHMDDFTDDEVARFKEQAKIKQQAKMAVGLLTPEPAAVSQAIVAEGDSWFNYPLGTDIIDCLRSNHNYMIHNYAQPGDTLENMIYGTGINNKFERVSPTIIRVLERLEQVKPKIFLFSGGGNDIAGNEFESYLNHKDSGLPALREQYANDIINLVFREYFEDLIGWVAEKSTETHILVHGHGYTAPTGVGANIFILTFAGPWLRPALARKRIFDHDEQRRLVFSMIDKYNELLKALSQRLPRFHHVDLRGMLDPDSDWVNELHLRNSAFARVANQIHEVIQSF